MEDFYVWRIEYDEGDAKLVRAMDAEWAAEQYSEDRFADMDYPPHIELWVRPKGGEKVRIDVEVRAVPEFHASIAKSDK